jgi:DNA-binding transcriptional LysR family regulator
MDDPCSEGRDSPHGGQGSGTTRPGTRARLRPPRTYLYFDAVARYGSIRKAADRLFLASSALTRHILQLEDQVGTPLFERVPRGVRLTPAGELLHTHVRETLQALDATCLRIDDLSGLVHGAVRIAAAETMAIEIVPRAIVEFRRRHPGVSFDLSTASGLQAIGALLSDQVDIILALNPAYDENLRVHITLPQEMCAVVRARHPLARRTVVSFAECAEYPLAYPQPGMGGRSVLDELATQLAFAAAPVFQSSSMEALKGFVRHCDAVAFQLSVGVQRACQLGELAAVPVSDLRDKTHIVIATRKGRRLPHAAAAFLEHLETMAQT